MPELHECNICLRFHGDDLDPDSLTALLGVQPTVGRPTARKGDVWIDPVTKQKLISRTGGWYVDLGTFIPADFNTPLHDLFQKMTGDLDIWQSLSAQFNGRISTLIWMESSNEGFQLEPDTIIAIAERGLALDIEICAPSTD